MLPERGFPLSACQNLRLALVIYSSTPNLIHSLLISSFLAVVALSPRIPYSVAGLYQTTPTRLVSSPQVSQNVHVRIHLSLAAEEEIPI